mgnify:CR=1 FL=1
MSEIQNQVLVVYSWERKRKSGFGSVDFTVDGDIPTIDSIRDMEKQICEKYKFKNVIILNIIELGAKDTLSP